MSCSHLCSPSCWNAAALGTKIMKPLPYSSSPIDFHKTSISPGMWEKCRWLPSRNLSTSNRLPPSLSESQLLRIVVLALQGWRDPLMLQAAAASQDTLQYRTIERSYDLQETGEGATVTSVSHIEGSRTESSNTFFDSKINVNPSRFFQLK